MRIGLLTEGGYPYASGEAHGWCDRLVRGLTGHDFALYALITDPRQEARGPVELPVNARLMGQARLWGDIPTGRRRAAGRRARRRFAEHFGDLAAACVALSAGEPAAGAEAAADGQADRFASGLYGLADLARGSAALPALLRSEDAVRALEAVCHGAGAPSAVRGAQVADLLAVAAELEPALRPLSLAWYGDAGLAGVDLCHAASAGTAALPGLLAKRFFGTPLLVTEHGVGLREHYLAHPAAPRTVPVRVLLAAFRRALAAETYARAALITPGGTRARRWQERCGADPARLRTVYPGMAAGPFAAVPDTAADDSATLVWTGAIAPDKDLVGLLHAFADLRRTVPAATLRIIGGLGADPEAAGYRAQCRALAAQLFPDEAADARTAGENPVSFEEIGGPTAPTAADAYASATVVVLSSAVEGFPRSLVEAMFCGRATVSTDTGAVCEVIGGTGLVVPPRNPRALADACRALLGDPERRARLGAAARARAFELFTVEQNIAAFRGIYLELIASAPGGPAGCGAGDGVPRPFARPAESRVPGGPPPTGTARTPSWAQAEQADPAGQTGGRSRRTRRGAAGEPAAGQVW
ncbi:DUF3492 domain-containing protein [Streptomyces sp. A1-5]|uniref:DUF3492 domain-containing protein n=1 Tax=Streptomyces sp. A1-5 TaxID=2738410 RepID=UPI001F1637B1|nr:DUF3492 domain-containing protein [Streptomyces sp. A1-5]UJB43881.1 DUF3492 domain-containing protein [Streptomyces sp. A1-5]